MATTSLNIRLDENLKRDAEQLFQDLGLSMSTAITIFLRQAVRTDGIPFDVCRDTPNAETRRALEDARLHRNLSGPYNSVDELMAAVMGAPEEPDHA